MYSRADGIPSSLNAWSYMKGYIIIISYNIRLKPSLIMEWFLVENSTLNPRNNFIPGRISFSQALFNIMTLLKNAHPPLRAHNDSMLTATGELTICLL